MVVEEKGKSKEINSLSHYLHHLQLGFTKDSSLSLSLIYRYCHNILNNQMTNWLENTLWILLYFFLYSLISFATIEISKMNNFYYSTSYSRGKFLATKLVANQLVILYSVINILVIAFQYATLFLDAFHKSLPSAIYKILNFSYTIYPAFSIAIGGLALGVIISTNLKNDFSLFTDLIVFLCAAMSCLLLLINVIFFQQITKYTILIGNRKFSSWCYPFDYKKLIVELLNGLFFVIRNLNNKPLNTIFYSLLIIFSIFFFFREQVPVYFHFSSSYLLYYLSISRFIFAVYGIANTWSLMSASTQFVYFLLLHAVSASFSLATTKFVFNTNRILGVNSAGDSFEKNKIGNKTEVEISLRVASNYDYPIITNVDYLSWILQTKFRPSLMCDVVRICLAKSVDMKNIQVTKLHLDQTSINSIRFLSYQVREFEKMFEVKTEGETLEILNNIRYHKEEITKTLNNFWLSTDLDIQSISNLSKKLMSTVNGVMQLAHSHSHSEEIVDEYIDLVTNVLASQSMIKKPPPYLFCSLLISDSGNAFDRATCIHSTQAIESYLKERIGFAKKPRFIFLVILFIFCLIGMAALIVLYNIRSGKLWDYFKENSILLKISKTLALRVLSSTNNVIELPEPSKIAAVLNLPLETAKEFRAKQPPTIKASDLAEVIEGMVFINHTEATEITQCRRIQLLSLLEFTAHEDDSIDMLYCYIVQSMHFSRHIEKIALERLDIYILLRFYTEKIVGNSSIVFGLISTVIYCFLVFHEYRNHGNFIRAVQGLFCFSTNCKAKINNEKRLPIIKVFVQFILLMGTSIASNFLFIHYTKNFEVEMIHLTTLLEALYDMDISSFYQIAIASYSVEVQTGLSLPGHREFYSRKIREDVQIAQNQLFADAYRHITGEGKPPVVLFNSLMNFGEVLTLPNITVESFDYLYGRYLFFYQCNELHESILNSASSPGMSIIQIFVRNYFLSVLAMAFISIIIGIWIVFDYISVSKWYQTVSILILRGVKKSPSVSRSIQAVLDNSPPVYVDELGFSAMLSEPNGRISYSNFLASSGIPLSQKQIANKNENEYFKPGENNLEVDIDDKHQLYHIDLYYSSDGRKLRIIRDVTELQKNRKMLAKVEEQLKPMVELPFSSHFIYFYADFLHSNFNNCLIAKEIFMKESRLIKLASCASFIAAAVEIGKEEDTTFIIRIIKVLKERFEKLFICAVEGDGVILGVDENSSLVQAAGEMVSRVNSVIQYTGESRTYIDFTILARSNEDIDSAIEISPLKI